LVTRQADNIGGILQHQKIIRPAQALDNDGAAANWTFGDCLKHLGLYSTPPREPGLATPATTSAPFGVS